MQLLLVAAALTLTAVLLMSRTKPMTESEITEVVSVDAEIDEAIALVNGAEPMKGIMMLRGILEEHPDNTRAIKQMGLFAMQSGQFDKAVLRFERGRELDPNDDELLFYLGLAKAGTGDNEGALILLEEYKTLIDDDSAIEEVERYIQELKTK